jgi:hypothetical protein
VILKDVFLLGNYVVWVTPSGDVMVIDASRARKS